jgi:Planctomycete cytochrome C
LRVASKTFPHLLKLKRILRLFHELDCAAERAHATAVNAAGRYVIPGVPEESSRIVVPGAPERSALLYRMRSRRPSWQMPPLGTSIPHDEATELVRRWIEGLGK